MHALRRSTLVRLLGVFALLGQLLLPNLHAQDWASRNGNGLLYAFCGSSPAILKQLQAFAPPELLRSVEHSEWAQHGQASCSLCIGWHGAHLAGAPLTSSSVLAAQLPTWAADSKILAPRWRITDFPWARGPPRFPSI